MEIRYPDIIWNKDHIRYIWLVTASCAQVKWVKWQTRGTSYKLLGPWAKACGKKSKVENITEDEKKFCQRFTTQIPTCFCLSLYAIVIYWRSGLWRFDLQILRNIYHFFPLCTLVACCDISEMLKHNINQSLIISLRFLPHL